MNKPDLYEVFYDILGSRNIYYQPPETIKLKYPCVIYKLNNFNTIYANDNPYISTKRYTITIIDKDPCSVIPEKVQKLQMCSFDRTYVADNLNHWVFNLYY